MTHISSLSSNGRLGSAGSRNSDISNAHSRATLFVALASRFVKITNNDFWRVNVSSLPLLLIRGQPLLDRELGRPARASLQSELANICSQSGAAKLGSVSANVVQQLREGGERKPQCVTHNRKSPEHTLLLPPSKATRFLTQRK